MNAASTTPPNPRPRVALAFPVGLAHLHRTLQGIQDYVRTHTSWSLVASTEAAGISIRSLRNWRGEGVIGVISTPDDLDQAKRLKVPFVSMSLCEDTGSLYFVRADHERIGRLAGEHLRTCGFQHYAYVGLRDSMYSDLRLAGFERAIAPHSAVVMKNQGSIGSSATLHDIGRELGDWLQALPKPVGIFTVSDAWARPLADACAEQGIAVPDEVAIVGVDDNEVMCQFGSPTLSSIPCNRLEIGYRAAEILDHLMRGQAVAERDLAVPPSDVVCRESTDIGIFSNAHATHAHRYIRDHLGEVFGAEELARHLGISRRRLEQCMKEATGHTPYDFICSLRVEHARQLLRDSSLKLQQIARACGFRDGRHLCKVFVKFTGQTPSEYRQSLRSGDERVSSIDT